MTRNRTKTALLCWLPVVAVVVALFAVPTSSGAAAPRLDVTPGSGQYGGTSVRWTGNIGSTGEQRIWLQRRGNTTSPWADVPHPKTGNTASFMTQRDGSFDFFFPAPAMNFVYFRVASRSGATPAHLFQSKHQDADVSLIEQNPLPSDVPLPRGIGVIGEPYRFGVDTVNAAGGEQKPTLRGRDVTLQRRGSDNVWRFVASGVIDQDGVLQFGPYGPGAGAQEPGYFRVRLQRWTQGGDDIGWFTSLPYHLELVHRPEPLTRLQAAPEHDKVTLTWIAPVDPLRDRIVIARTGASQSPTAAKEAHIIATLPPGAQQYVDRAVFPNNTYRYAVYSVSADGVYTDLEERVETFTPAPPEGGRG